MHKALVKANNDLISWCKCTQSVYATMAQLDCPWCGCGWMFSCMTCRRAFTFARVVVSDIPLQHIMQQERTGYYKRPVPLDDEEVISRTDWLAYELEPLLVGTICTYLDGKVLAVDWTDIDFNGFFGHHVLDAVPQWSALKSGNDINALLGNTSYWLERELKDRERQ